MFGIGSPVSISNMPTLTVKASFSEAPAVRVAGTEETSRAAKSSIGATLNPVDLVVVSI